MESYDAKTKLYSKVESEYKQYCYDLLYSSATDIIEKSRQTATKMEIMDALEPDSSLNKLDLNAINYLLKQDNTLSYLYNSYLESNIDFNKQIKDFFEELSESLEYSVENEL